MLIVDRIRYLVRDKWDRCIQNRFEGDSFYRSLVWFTFVPSMIESRACITLPTVVCSRVRGWGRSNHTLMSNQSYNFLTVEKLIASQYYVDVRWSSWPDCCPQTESQFKWQPNCNCGRHQISRKTASSSSSSSSSWYSFDQYISHSFTQVSFCCSAAQPQVF